MFYVVDVVIGVNVGLFEGIIFGLNVFGDLVGFNDDMLFEVELIVVVFNMIGEKVGLMDGIDVEGEKVGFSNGDEEGFIVGDNVDGDELGFKVGRNVDGYKDGFDVGNVVGDEVVGKLLGIS